MDESRSYRTLVLLEPSLDGEALEDELGRIRAIFATRGAEDVKSAAPDRRRLAYPIGKRTDGIYVAVRFNAPPESIAVIENDLKLRETVMRAMTNAESPRREGGGEDE